MKSKYWFLILAFYSAVSAAQDNAWIPSDWEPGKNVLFRSELKEREPRTFSSELYIIFNHSSKTWDKNESSKEATLRLLDISRNNQKIKTITAVDEGAAAFDGAAKLYFMKSADVNHTIISRSGSHKMNFLNAKTLIFAGGNLSLCLCESIRDSIKFSNSNLNILLVADAIFEGSFYAKKYVDRSTSLKEVDSLENIMKLMDEDRIKAYFNNEVFGKKGLCPHQHYYSWQEEPYSNKGLTINLIKETQNIGHFGKGKRVISFYITNIKDLESDLTKLEETW